jgi:hypothetical protein
MGFMTVPFEAVYFGAFTRKIESVHKGWIAPDSAAFTKEIDSVTQSLITKGARRFNCKFQPTILPPGTLSYWKFRPFIIRVEATGAQYRDYVPYQINISGLSSVPYECLHPLPTRRESSGVCQGEVVRIPLPRGWVWCWRNPLWS